MSRKFILNGKKVVSHAPDHTTLLSVLREEMGLTGAKAGCEMGECGACTVIMDGRAVNACLVLIGEAEGKSVLTIEGLGRDGNLDPIQIAFAEMGAVQCGYCTPGMILSVKALLDKNPEPTVDEIKTGIAGNLCRCTGYTQIIEAVEHVVKWRKKHENQ